uniref:Uncharacterized protein n=1 Tax=Scleropages formosus TaxID=113540 RepID=A0A8C9R616_SCLFO
GSLILQHNSHKMLATAQGIAHDYKKKKLVFCFFSRKLACNGKLQGDQRKNICQFLLQVYKSCFGQLPKNPVLQCLC